MDYGEKDQNPDNDGNKALEARFLIFSVCSLCVHSSGLHLKLFTGMSNLSNSVQRDGHFILKLFNHGS